MPLKTVVKVGSITNLSDARYCAGMGVDFLGFRAVEGQENYLPPKKYQEIRGWVTGPQTVAEVYGLTEAAQLDVLLEDYKPDYLEMGMAELNLFATLPLPVILRVEGEIPAGLRLKPRYLLVTTLKGHGDSIPLLLEVNRPGEMPDVLGEGNGLALNGGSEISPGLRDYSGLAEILEQLEVE